MADKSCPSCNLINPDSAVRCDCGYDFHSQRVERTYLEEKHLNWNKMNKNTKRALFWIALIIVFKLTQMIVLYSNSYNHPPAQRQQLNQQQVEVLAQSQRDPLDNLSSREKIRFGEIIKGVLSDPNYLTRDIHDEFWRLRDKIGSLSAAEEQKERDMMVGTATYQRYFYEDALWALKKGSPYKSLQRENFEKRLLKIGVIPEWRIKENEALIEKIATKKEVPHGGSYIIFTEELILKILDGLEATSKRVEKLYTREWKDEP